MFRKLKNPILFQGRLTKKNYFEGWYYKNVSADGSYSVAVIPGISINSDNPHAFIQVFVTHKNEELKTVYIGFDVEQFVASDQPFSLKIGDNIFTENSIDLQIDHPDLKISGRLQFAGNTKIKTSVLSPSIMGYFGYFTFMECYHGVVSMHHALKGELKIDGKTVPFTKGWGYIEKDWGSSFPREYVWMQTNHFTTEGTAFMFSEAIIPFLGFHFNGLIVSLMVAGKEFRFATYNHAKVAKKEISHSRVYYEIAKGKLKLTVEALNDKTTSLASPKNGVMNQSIKEGLSGKVKLQLYEDNQLIYEDTGTHAGLEIMMQPT